jgi:hypothetical protein
MLQQLSNANERIDAHANIRRFPAEFAYPRQKLMFYRLGVYETGKGGQSRQAQLLYLNDVGLERATHHGQYVLFDIARRSLGQNHVHIAQDNEQYLNWLL